MGSHQGHYSELAYIQTYEMKLSHILCRKPCTRANEMHSHTLDDRLSYKLLKTFHIKAQRPNSTVEGR